MAFGRGDLDAREPKTTRHNTDRRPCAKLDKSIQPATHDVVINENGFMDGLKLRIPAVVAAIAFDELIAFIFSSAMFEHRDQIVSALAANQHGVTTRSAANGL